MATPTSYDAFSSSSSAPCLATISGVAVRPDSQNMPWRATGAALSLNYRPLLSYPVDV
jgi:hypothetical protein